MGKFRDEEPVTKVLICLMCVLIIGAALFFGAIAYCYIAGTGPFDPKRIATDYEVKCEKIEKILRGRDEK